MSRKGISFTDLREANILCDKVWNPHNLLTPLFRATELAGEIGEACNVIKKLEREKLGLVGSRDTLDHLGEELADGFICLDLIAMSYDLSMSLYVPRKFNYTSRQRGLDVFMKELLDEA